MIFIAGLDIAKGKRLMSKVMLNNATKDLTYVNFQKLESMTNESEGKQDYLLFRNLALGQLKSDDMKLAD